MALAGCVLLVATLEHFKSVMAGERRRVNNNPDKFYLWTNSKTIHHAFEYDPHAADVWLFESGGGKLSVTNTAATNAANLR